VCIITLYTIYVTCTTYTTSLTVLNLREQYRSIQPIRHHHEIKHKNHIVTSLPLGGWSYGIYDGFEGAIVAETFLRNHNVTPTSGNVCATPRFRRKCTVRARRSLAVGNKSRLRLISRQGVGESATAHDNSAT